MNAIDSLFISIGIDSSSLQRDMDAVGKVLVEGSAKIAESMKSEFSKVLSSGIFSDDEMRRVSSNLQALQEKLKGVSEAVGGMGDGGGGSSSGGGGKSPWTKEIDRAAGVVEGKLKGFRSQLLSPFKMIMGGAFAGFSIATLTKQYLEQADALGKQAKAMGVSVENLNAWQQAAKQAGGSTAGFTTTVRRLSSVIQRAQSGKGPAADAFRKLGVNIKGANGKARDVFEILPELAGAAGSMSAQEFEGLSRSLGIDQGTVMLLQKGREEVEKMVAAEMELGVITTEDAKIAEEANNAIDDLKKTLSSIVNLILRDVVPWITRMTEKLGAFFKEVRGHEPFLKAFIGGLAVLLTGTLVPALVKTSIAFAGVSVPILAIIAAIAALALAFDDLYVFFNSDNYDDSLLGHFLGEDKTKRAKNAAKELTTIFEGFAEPFKKIGEDFKTVKDAIFDGWDLFKEEIKELFPIFDDMGRWFDIVGDKFKGWVDKALEWLNPLLSKLKDINKEMQKVVEETLGGDPETAAGDAANALGQRLEESGVLKPKPHYPDGGPRWLSPEEAEELYSSYYSGKGTLAAAFNMSQEQIDAMRAIEREALGGSYAGGRYAPRVGGNTNNNVTNNNDIKIEVTPENLKRALDAVKERFGGGKGLTGGVNQFNSGVALTSA